MSMIIEEGLLEWPRKDLLLVGERETSKGVAEAVESRDGSWGASKDHDDANDRARAWHPTQPRE